MESEQQLNISVKFSSKDISMKQNINELILHAGIKNELEIVIKQTQFVK